MGTNNFEPKKTKIGKQSEEDDYNYEGNNSVNEDVAKDVPEQTNEAENKGHFAGTPTEGLPPKEASNDHSKTNIVSDMTDNDSNDFCSCNYPNDEGVSICVNCKRIIRKNRITSDKPYNYDNRTEINSINHNDMKTNFQGSHSDPNKTQAAGQQNDNNKTRPAGQYPPPQNQQEAASEGEPFKILKTQSAKKIVEDRARKIYLIPHPFDTDNKIEFKDEDNHNIISRDKLEPGNYHISGKHAEIYYQNGKWFLKDTSSKKETYIRVDECELKDGDEILLGNRFFKFKCEE